MYSLKRHLLISIFIALFVIQTALPTFAAPNGPNSISASNSGSGKFKKKFAIGCAGSLIAIGGILTGVVLYEHKSNETAPSAWISPQVTNLSFGTWAEKYGSTSAIAAHDKTHAPTKLGKEMRSLLDAVVAGKVDQVQFQAPQEGEEVQRQQSAPGPRPVWQAYGYDERDLKLLDNVKRTIDAADNDELVIVFAGETHALDYFFKVAQGPKPAVIYTGIPIRTDTQNYSPEMMEVIDLFQELKKTSEGLNFADEFVRKAHTSKAESALSGWEIPFRYAAAVHEVQGKPELGPSQDFRTKVEAPVTPGEKPKVIFLMDYHELQSIDHILSMPSVADIAKNYSRVTLSFEGYNPGQQIPSANYLVKREYWSSFNVYALELLQDVKTQMDEELSKNLGQLNKKGKAYYLDLQKRVNKAIKDIKEGRVTNHPAEHAILYKMKLLEDAGVNVQIIGNDARKPGDQNARFNEVSPDWHPEKMPDIPWGWPSKPLK